MPTISPPAGLLTFKGPQSPTSQDRWLQSGTLLLTGLAFTVALSTAMPAGAVTLAGQTPTAARGPSSAIDIPASALLWTGLPPVPLIQGSSVPMGAGSLLWTGLAPISSIVTVTIVPPAGSLVFKGPARPQSVPMPGCGSLILAGQIPSPSVSTGGSSPTIGMPVGLLAWHSDPLTISADRSILIPVGSLVLAGQYFGVAFSPLGAGSLIWQGLIPTVMATSQGVIEPNPGAMTWLGIAPISHLDQGPQMPAGVLTFASTAPQSGQTSTVTPGAGVLTFSSVAPQSLRDLPSQPGAGHIAFAAQEVAVFLETTYAPGAGRLTWTGYIAQPTVTAFDPQTALPGAGILTFSSVAPVTAETTTTAFQPDAGILTLSSDAPTLLIDVAMVMPAGALVFSGQAPTPPLFPTAGQGLLVFSGQRVRSVNSGDASPIPPLSYGAGMFFYQSQRRQNP